MSHEEQKTQISKPRISLKKDNKPIFDEKQYRADFYEIVLEIQPLFQQIPEIISEKYKEMKETLIQQPKSNQDGKKFADFRPHWINKIAGLIKQKMAGLSSSITVPDEEIQSRKEILQAALREINNKFGLINREKNDFLKNIFGISKIDLKMELLKTVALLDYTLDLAGDDLRTFYQIDGLTCLDVICSEEREPKQQQSLIDALYFDYQLYNSESKRDEMIKRAFQKTKFKGFNLLNAGSEQEIDLELTKKIEELIAAFKTKIEGSALEKLLQREYEEKKRSLENANLSNLLAENIYVEFEKKIEEIYKSQLPEKSLLLQSSINWESQIQKWEGEKKFEQITKFTKQRTTAYMSVQSITDYECYKDSIMEKFKQILGEPKFDQLVNLLMKSLQTDLEGNLLGKKSIKDILTKEEILEKIEACYSLSSRIDKIVELLTSDEVFREKRKIKIQYTAIELENIIIKKIRETTYFCNFEDGVKLMRLPPKDPNKKVIISEYSKSKETGKTLTIKLSESTKFRKLLGDITYYLQPYAGDSYTSDFLKKLKTYVAIVAYEANKESQGTLILHQEDLVMLLQDILDNKEEQKLKNLSHADLVESRIISRPKMVEEQKQDSKGP